MATADGTARLLRRAVERGAVHAANVRTLAAPVAVPAAAAGHRLSVAAVGFGAYRVGGGEQEPSHLAALRAALRSGVNLLDTSSHYSAGGTPGGGHGASERLVGRSIAEAVAAGEAEREGLVVCTKLGHVAQGAPVPPGAVAVGPEGADVWHSIDPEFIDSEVRASKERLGTAPDFVLLHNPEYFLSAQLQRRVPIAEAWDEMYTRLERAFGALEALCDEGVIASGYGVSGNFLSCIFSTTGRPNLYEALALDRVVGAAAAAAAAQGGPGAHRMRLVQLPLNAIESGAVLGRAGAVPEAAEGDCALAARLGLSVITNRPLNSLPLPGVSSGDWGRDGASHLRLREAKPMGAVESLLRRVLLEALHAGAPSGGAQPPAPMPLQQVALRVALSAPWVASSLCGMRTQHYVEDAQAVLREPPLAAEQALRALAAVRVMAEELGCQRRGLW